MGRFLIVFVLCVGLVSCAVDDVFSADDAKRLQNLVVKQQQKNGMWSSIAETDNAIFVLKSLDVSVGKKKKICQKLGGPLPENVEMLYHTVRASKTLGCADIDITSIQPSLQDAISGTGINLKDAFYAWKVILMTGTIERFDCQTTIGLVVELMEDDGSFRHNTDSDDSSVVNAGYALQLVGEIFSNIKALQDPSLGTSEELRELADKVKEITELETTFRTDLSPIAATAIVVGGFQALSIALEEQLDIDQEYIDDIAQFFLDNKYVSGVIDSSFLLEGLKFCVDNNMYEPLSLIVTDGLNVRLTNVKNEPVDGDNKVQLVGVVSSSEVEILSNVELTSVGDGNFKIQSKVWDTAEPGFYSLTYATDSSNILRSAKINGKITKTIIEVYATDSLKSSMKDVDLFRTTYPVSLSDTVKLDKKFFVVNVVFKGNVAPSQVFVQLSKGSKSSVFVAKSGDDDDTYTMKAEIESSDFYELIFGSGEYTVSLIVGDALLEDSFSWSVGKFAITISPEIQEAIAEPEDLFKKLPDIEHQFKKPEDAPPAILALVYTIIVLLPLGWLLISVVANVKLSLPTSPTEFLSAMIFQGSLAAFLALYVLYWLNLTIFQALLGIGLLSICAILSGNKTLRLLHERINKRKTA